MGDLNRQLMRALDGFVFSTGGGDVYELHAQVEGFGRVYYQRLTQFGGAFLTSLGHPPITNLPPEDLKLGTELTFNFSPELLGGEDLIVVRDAVDHRIRTALYEAGIFERGKTPLGWEKYAEAWHFVKTSTGSYLVDDPGFRAEYAARFVEAVLKRGDHPAPTS